MNFDNLETIKHSYDHFQPNDTTLDEIYDFYQPKNTSQESLTQQIAHDFSYSHQGFHIHRQQQLQQKTEQSQMCHSLFRQKIVHKLSGVHEKYLNSNASPLTKKSFRSQKKIISSVRPQLMQKMEKRNIKEPCTEEIFKLNPLNQGLQGLKIEAEQLYNQLFSRFNKSQDEKNMSFLQLGLKQPKALGKGRTQREIKNILKFLQTGEMPQQYITLFLQSLRK